FKSSASSYHSTLLSKNTAVAGTILANKIEWLSLKGIQFTGKVLDNSFPHPVKPQTYYHKVFPLAVAKPGDVWCIKLEMIKMTDNSQVFGKKLEWHKREQ
ncbi:MAG: hypothetical protein JWQ25_1140, partial [Daejeonella sp.]|nr:hypothetical protein [Daejeonella sp.]